MLKNFYVQNDSGSSVPLSTLVKITDIKGPEFLLRQNLYLSLIHICKAILEKGYTVPPMQQFMDFMSRKPRMDAMLRKRRLASRTKARRGAPFRLRRGAWRLSLIHI